MSRPNRYKVGVVGAGRMGSLHLNKLKSIPEAELVGFFDHNQEKSLEVSETTGLPYFKSLEELLFEADAVVVATPAASLYKTANKALSAGVHVLLEKPMAESSEESQRLIQLASENDLVLQVGYLERFRMYQMMDLIPKNEIVRIEAARMASGPGRDSNQDVVGDLMVHDIDLVLSLIPSAVADIRASGFSAGGRLQQATVELKFENGATADLKAGRFHTHAKRSFSIWQKNVLANLDFITNRVSIMDSVAEKLEEIELDEIDPLFSQGVHFIDCVSSNLKPLVSGEDGLRAVHLVQWIREVAGTEKKVPLKDQQRPEA